MKVTAFLRGSQTKERLALGLMLLETRRLLRVRIYIQGGVEAGLVAQVCISGEINAGPGNLLRLVNGDVLAEDIDVLVVHHDFNARIATGRLRREANMHGRGESMKRDTAN